MFETGKGKIFVLIHGTWHGGWAWKDVIQQLSEKGHTAHAPTLAGHGPGVMRSGVTHQDCVAPVAEYIQHRDLRDIVLVGHSFGGTVAQKVADQFPDRIARIVFLDALILKDKERVFDILPEVFLHSLAPKNSNEPIAESSENSEDLLPPPRWETWRDNFIQDAPESVARRTWEQLSPAPSQVNLDTIALERFYSLTVPKSLIYCRQDKAMPPAYFHPRMSSRLEALKLIEMDGSHEVMLTRPTELAEKIVEASAE